MIIDQTVWNDVTVGDLLYFVLVIIGTILIGHLAYALVRRFLQDSMSKPSAKAAARLLEYGIIIIGLYFAFYQVLGLDITGALISLGIVGIALAFASQQIIQNAFAGVLFTITRPLQLEDWVEVGGMPATGLCRVKDITLVHTVMRDIDGRILYIPNSFILNNKLINYTKAGFVAVPFQIRIFSSDDYERIRKIVLEEADRHPYILPNVKEDEKKAVTKVIELGSFRYLYSGGKLDLSPFEPQVNVTDLQRSRTVMTVKVWIREVNRRDLLLSELLNAIKRRATEEGIELADS